jgi:hypothetical protein
MTTEEFKALTSIRPIFIKLLAAAFALGVAWTTLESQLSEKVSNTVFTRYVTASDSLKMEIIQELRELRRGQQETHSFLCQTRKSDFGCQPR